MATITTWQKFYCTRTTKTVLTFTESAWSYSGVPTSDETSGAIGYDIQLQYDNVYKYELRNSTTVVSFAKPGTVYNISSDGYTIYKTTYDAQGDAEVYSKFITTTAGLATTYEIGKYITDITTQGATLPDSDNGYSFQTNYLNYVIMKQGNNYFAYLKTKTTDSVSHIYIGVPTEFPIYDEEEVTINVGGSNLLSSYFSTIHDSYSFWEEQDGWYHSDNYDVNDSFAQLQLTAKENFILSFDYRCSTEKNYDIFTITLNSDQLVQVSGTKSGSLTVTMLAGDYLTFLYTKDYSSSFGDDSCSFGNLKIVKKQQVQVGSVIKDVARGIKNINIGVDNVARIVTQVYIGIGGVARPCWAGGNLVYWGNPQNLSRKGEQMGTATVGNYVLFGGGGPSYDVCHLVDAYDTSLVRTSAPPFDQRRYDSAGASIGNYALFAGGWYSGSYSIVDAYDASLTKTTLSTGLNTNANKLKGVTIGNYAVFAGGGITNVNAFDKSLTRTNPTSLSTARSKLAATTVGNFALFGGGYTSTRSNIVEAYNTSLTYSAPTNLSLARDELAAASTQNYALFGGGVSATNSTSSAVVDAYDKSLVRTTPTSLYSGRWGLAATSLDNYAIFAGGCTTNGPYQSTVVDMYNAALTRTTPLELNQGRDDLNAITFNNYALFYGGRTPTETSSSSIEVYMFK